ncbi:hypothetical protein HanPI659440_Chr08g0299321 [Helianthus annuus]|nr:hypothetical protein HanPI659440_Chr08g0299321 [Helianthus annuus]
MNNTIAPDTINYNQVPPTLHRFGNFFQSGQDAVCCILLCHRHPVMEFKVVLDLSVLINCASKCGLPRTFFTNNRDEHIGLMCQPSHQAFDIITQPVNTQFFLLVTEARYLFRVLNVETYYAHLVFLVRVAEC